MAGKNSPVNELQSHAAPVQMGSERSFGLVFAALFAVIALWPLKSGGDIRLWALGAAAAFAVLALAVPRALKPLNIVWFKFGMLLHHVVTPVVMGLLFFLTVTPVGLLMRGSTWKLARSGIAVVWEILAEVVEGLLGPGCWLPQCAKE